MTWDFGGALGGTRTPNLLIRSQMLYPLSYERVLRRQSTIRGGSLGSVVGRQLMTYSESRVKYAETLNAVVDDRETAYLLRSPENARRLLASIDRLEQGGGIERGLAE